MAILEDAMNEAVEESAAEEIENRPAEPDYIEPNFSIDFSFLRTETGAGNIEDYINHVLNINGSRATAQILRGLTGLFGALNLAVIDIALGICELIKEKRIEKTTN